MNIDSEIEANSLQSANSSESIGELYHLESLASDAAVAFSRLARSYSADQLVFFPLKSKNENVDFFEFGLRMYEPIDIVEF